MKRPSSLLVVLGALAGVACSLSNLDAITRKPAEDGSVGDVSGGGSAAAGAGRGGSSTSSAGLGDAGSGGTGGEGVGGGAAGAGGVGGSAGGDAGGTAGGGTAGEGTAGGGTANAACPASTFSPGDTTEALQVGSLTRSYFLHIPSTYDGSRPVPLIVDFHFLGNSGSQEQRVSPFPAVTEAEGVIVAFPNGQAGPAGTAWNIGPCCVGTDVDDVAFARALVDELRTKACIDSKRVYAVGYAVGGGMAHYVGCHAADVFAAIAPVGFDLLAENSGDCQPSRPLTVVAFRELSDVLVPYEGGSWTMVPGMDVTLLGAEKTFAKWAEINRCTGSPSADDSNGCSTYDTCKDGIEVVLCTKQAGVPVPDNGTIAWPILQRHSMP